MKKRQWIVYLAVAVVLAALVLWAFGHAHFQWSVFRDQIRHLNWALIVLGVAMIYLGFILRALRWALLMRPQKHVGAFALLGSQVIGFTGVGLFGRLADLLRPYLVARRTQVTLASQVAVYTVERMFDLGSVAFIFAAALLLAPDRAALPHHEALEHAALAALLVAFALGCFAIVVRVAGKAVARMVRSLLGTLSSKLGEAMAEKILAFRDGLSAIDSTNGLLMISLISLLMWGMIVIAYLATMHAFVLSPVLSSISVARVLVLMAVSMAGSLVYLPVVGWFTQIALLAAAMTGLFKVPAEGALGCSTMLLFVTSLAVIPLGLLWAHFDRISLKKVSEESEMAAAQAGHAPVTRQV